MLTAWAQLSYQTLSVGPKYGRDVLTTMFMPRSAETLEGALKKPLAGHLAHEDFACSSLTAPFGCGLGARSE